MFEHQVESAASTLRTQPTSFVFSRATYWRKGAFLPSFSDGMGLVRVALPNWAAISVVRTCSTVIGDRAVPLPAGGLGRAIFFSLLKISVSV
jgi:hypothetical protein